MIVFRQWASIQLPCGSGTISLADKLNKLIKLNQLMDQGRDNSDKKILVSLLTLPTELLVYIISFLTSIRDRVKLRYVSRWLRCVTEGTPSLWKEFIWYSYDSSDEYCLKRVLKMCGHNISLLSFSCCKVPPPLVEILQYCGNVQHLSLPSTQLDPEQLQNIVKHMISLQALEFIMRKKDIKQLLLNTVNLKVLTIRSNEFKEVFNNWIELQLKPPKLNFYAIVPPFITKEFVDYVSQLTTIPTGITAIINVYNRYSSEAPIAFHPELPTAQLIFKGSGRVTIPCIKLSDIGIQGLNNDVAVMTDSHHGVRKTCMVKYLSDDNNVIMNNTQINHITNLSSITHCQLSHCTLLQPFHLKQLAMACPNLQRLGLQDCYHCLESLQGLLAIASHCHKLEGLGLPGIHVSNVEDHILMWEILSNMKLTLLNVEFCILRPKAANKKRLIELFKKCWGITGMSIAYGCRCPQSFSNKDQGILMLSHFPLLYYCCVEIDLKLPTIVQDMINNCKELRNFHFRLFNEPLSLRASHNQHLQLLHFSSIHTNVPDEFMTSVSAHGGLVHVVMRVKSLTAKGITSLVRNSPNLILLNLLQQSALGVNVENFDVELKTLFQKRRLFIGGYYRYSNNESSDEE